MNYEGTSRSLTFIVRTLESSLPAPQFSDAKESCLPAFLDQKQLNLPEIVKEHFKELTFIVRESSTSGAGGVAVLNCENELSDIFRRFIIHHS